MGKKAFTFAAAAALLASVLAVAGCPNSPVTGGDGSAASVNGVAIPVTKVDQIIDQQLKQGGQTAPQLSPVAMAAARLQVLDQLIQEEALYQRAQKDSLTPTEDEVKQELQSRIQKSGMSQDDYQARLKQMGQTEEDLKTDIKRELAIKKLQDKVTATIPPPTDAEMKKFFDENKAQLVAPRGVDLSAIIVDPANNGGGPEDAVGQEAALRKAAEIVGQLRGGADFATVARARSEDQSGMQGGQIGFFSEAQLQQTFPKEVADRLFAMQPGQILDPIQGQGGRVHIIKLNGKREQTQELTYDQVKQQIAQTITDQRKQVVLSALLVDAVASASIKNNLAAEIVANPGTFGALHPVTTPAGAPPAVNTNAAEPSGTATEAQPGAPVNTNAAPPANKNTAAPAENTNAK